MNHFVVFPVVIYESAFANSSVERMFMHCKEIWICVFPEKELRGLSPSFHIHVSVSDLYIPTFGPPIVLQQNRQTDQGENI